MGGCCYVFVVAGVGRDVRLKVPTPSVSVFSGGKQDSHTPVLVRDGGLVDVVEYLPLVPVRQKVQLLMI